MTRILLVETASPKRVLYKLRQILDMDLHPQPDISVLCRESSRSAFAAQVGPTIIPYTDPLAPTLLKELNKKKFDVLYAFWTGERQYRRMKMMALRLKAAERHVVAGDGNEFHLTWKALCRHSLFRLRHPLPTDHWDYIPAEPFPGASYRGAAIANERVLILQSAEPAYILQALDRLEGKPLFHNPRYTLFCRNRPEIVDALRAHPMIRDIRLHSETRGSGTHLRELRRQKFDAVILFLTGDPSYWKLKIFAFLLGVPRRRMLIFNESMDCFYFSWNQWLGLILHRMQSKPFPEASSRWTQSARILVSLLLKSAILPFRFMWLLLVWLRLRIAGLRYSRKNHDDSSRLPIFPGA